VKERPILFNGPMVKAILDGRKGQTRRVMNPQPQPFLAHDLPGPFWWFQYWRKGYPHGRILETDLPARVQSLCPYGAPGDTLWCRETWCKDMGRGDAIVYQADGLEPVLSDRWRPSIHMPRWASRITLDVLSVRAERLQAISEADAQAEGADPFAGPYVSHVAAFSALWDSINAKRGFGWDANPWVWTIVFRRIQP
jgi:hypothetical protein